MQGLQGARNLRELFANKYQPDITQRGQLFENNFFNQNKASQLNQRQSKNQPLIRNHVINSRDGSLEKGINAQAPRLPMFSLERQSPDPKFLQQSKKSKKFSITNQGFHKQQQLEEFLQKSLLINSDLQEQKQQTKSLHKTAKIYRIQVPQSNQSSMIMMNQTARRDSSRDNQQMQRESLLLRSNRMDRQYLELANIIQPEEKVTMIKNSLERDGVTRRSQSIQQQQISRNHFHVQFVIGKGGFGKVWKVEARKSKILYAMKEMSKAKILSKKSVNSVMNERVLLSSTKHPFLVNMVQAFQDRDNLYLIMDLLTGGDLRYHVGRLHRFKENQTKFFVACMILALEHLHDNNIIHRDIKPENLVLDSKGYLRVTDLGVARVLRLENSQDTSGTPGYMAPEVMCRQNHGIAVDYFAVGVIAFEFMLGRVYIQQSSKRPYVGRNRREIRDQVLAKQVQIKRIDIPEGWSIEAADFINKSLQRKPQNRLGFNGPKEVKSHVWFKNYRWDLLLAKQVEAPFMPKTIDDNFDSQQQISSENESQDELMQQNVQLLRRKSVQQLFNGYGSDASSPTCKSTANTSTNQITSANADKY